MALPHAKSGDLVSLPPLCDAPDCAPSQTLIRDEHIEVFLLALQAGTRLREHKAAGAMTLHCLGIEIRLYCHDSSRTLTAGDLVYLRDAEPHAVQCLRSARLLITLILRRK
jgi:quercetin dioxygenase-like cupin family protein